MRRTYVITGATGKTGRPVTLGLLEKSQTVRIITRDPEKARDLKDHGADVYVGDTRNEALLQKVFQGADAVYALLPMDASAPDYTAMQVAHATAIRNAVVTAGVKHVVALSSVGAELSACTGVVLGLHKMEELLAAVDGLNLLIVRAAYFLENTLSQIQVVKLTGTMASPVSGAVALPMVAAGDISDMVLENLLSLDFSGKSIRYALGQRDVSYLEIARVLGAAIGKPDLKYVAVPFGQASQVMLQSGMGASIVAKLLEYTKLINEGKVSDFCVRTPDNTTPTSLEAFARIFKAAYDANE